MIPPILIPVPQFCDADGKPLAGGSVATYVRGTSTPKTVWVDPDKTAAQSNPIVLDAAGRCTWYGDGEYRLILRDAAGNLIWDQDSTTIVSAAMAPVVAAPTIADAVHLLGLDDTISGAELSAAITAEQNARIAADNAERDARIAADNTLGAGLTSEANTRLAQDNILQAEIDALSGGGGGGGPVASFKSGTATVSAGATGSTVYVTFPVAFPTACTAFVATCNDIHWIGTAAAAPTFIVLNLSTVGANVYAFPIDATLGLIQDVTFYWIAAGN
jgi:hypothetical protein